MYKNSSDFTSNQNRISRPIERIGIIPDSIPNVKRLFTQIFPNSNILVIQRIPVSRYQVLVLSNVTLSNFYSPFINILTRTFLFFCSFNRAGTNKRYFFKFLFRKKSFVRDTRFWAATVFRLFSSPLLYESPPQRKVLIIQTLIIEAANFRLNSELNQFTNAFPVSQTSYQRKTVQLAAEYNQTSIHSLTSLLWI
jgi:hypothetical protein